MFHTCVTAGLPLTLTHETFFEFSTLEVLHLWESFKISDALFQVALVDCINVSIAIIFIFVFGLYNACTKHLRYFSGLLTLEE